MEEKQIGLVQTFTKVKVSGWVRAAEPAKVSLCVNETPLCSTWASKRLEGETAENARAFQFRLRDIWSYVTPEDHLSIKINQQAIPISGHGDFLSPERKGRKSSAQLVAMLRQDHIFNQFGRLQVSKLRDTSWQKGVAALYERLSRDLKSLGGVDLFAFYGTLLGAVRHGDFIGHDHDFDAAFVSRHRRPDLVRQEMVALASALIEKGYRIKPKQSCVLIGHPEIKRAEVDMFHLYFDENDALVTAFGVASEWKFRMQDYLGVGDGKLGDMKVLLPQPAEKFAELIYGEDWRIPNPGFSWRDARRSASREAKLDPAEQSAIYWNNFYADREPGSASPFLEYVRSTPFKFARAIDFGCGDGRDTVALGSSGVDALGVDRAEQGVRHAQAYVAKRELPGRVNFVQGDVGDKPGLSAVIKRFVDERPSSEPTLFYSRFFLHSLPDETRATFLETVAEALEPKDYFALEFRTSKDKKAAKVHTGHFRAFIDPRKLKKQLQALGLKILVFQIGNGFSIYKSEDPHLCRIIAAKR